MWPRLPPRAAFETEFQAGYYARIRSTLRLVSPLMVALLLINLALSASLPTSYDLPIALPQLGFWTLIFALTWTPSFARVWQPVVAGLGWLTAFLVLGRLVPLLIGEVVRLRGAGLEPPTLPQQKFYFMVQFTVLTVSLATLRLQWRWAAPLYGGVLAIGVWAFATLPQAPEPFLDVRFVFLPSLLIVAVLMLAAGIEERLARGAYEANRRLALLQAEEHQKRLETEKMLHVLNGAIGGIVHDLGNPLTTVQMGASTLGEFLDEDVDKATLREFIAMIDSGAQMLNFLRLSLIEQSRVLEGKPVPVELKPTPIRAVVEAGFSFQKPRFAQGHTLTLAGDDLFICADDPKMVTVMMNLIGNALKYSDGEVRVRWQAREGVLLLAVLDRGKAGRGLTKDQASRLFRAFGRLETHANIEGTGLGLMSVQNILEAHGGAVWIEGNEAGTPDSAPFWTRLTDYPPQLCDSFRTAFVLTCPLATRPLENDVSK
ncbi:MAG TPA: HAMP domain-containing sensor histidine kinase [Abditibacterium sp.]|jgi:signal transduction histidine kinase